MRVSASVIASEIIRLILFIPFLPPKIMPPDFAGCSPHAIARATPETFGRRIDLSGGEGRLRGKGRGNALSHHGFNACNGAATVSGVAVVQRDFCIVMMTIGESPDVRL